MNLEREYNPSTRPQRLAFVIDTTRTVQGRVQLKHDGLNEKIVWTYRNNNCKKLRIKSRGDNKMAVRYAIYTERNAKIKINLIKGGF